MRGLTIMIFVLVHAATAFAQYAGLRETTSAHFTIQYEPDYTVEDVELLKSELELAHRVMNEKYGFRVPGKVRVYLTSSEVSYSRKVAVQQHWGAAYTNGTLYIQPLSDVQRAGGLRITVRHALAHVVLQPIIIRGCPPWLAESFAVHFSGEMEILDKPSQTSIKFFTDLNEAFQGATGSAEIEASFYMLGLGVRYFEERFGARKVAQLFKSFDGLLLDYQVMEKVFGLPYDDLQYGWARYIDRQIHARK